MSNLHRLLTNALKSNPRVSLPPHIPISLSTRSLSTDAPDSQPNEPSIDPILRSSGQGLVFGKLTGAYRNSLKTDIIHFFEGCKLSPSDIKFEYSRGYNPTGLLLQFSSPSAFDMAVRQIVRKGRIYKLDKVSKSQWDIAKSYDGKAVLLQGLPRNAIQEDIERFLSGCNYDPSSFETFLRPGFPDPDPVRISFVKFPTQLDATNAFRVKNRSFCLNNPVSMRILH